MTSTLVGRGREEVDALKSVQQPFPSAKPSGCLVQQCQCLKPDSRHLRQHSKNGKAPSRSENFTGNAKKGEKQFHCPVPLRSGGSGERRKSQCVCEHVMMQHTTRFLTLGTVLPQQKDETVFNQPPFHYASLVRADQPDLR